MSTLGLSVHATQDLIAFSKSCTEDASSRQMQGSSVEKSDAEQSGGYQEDVTHDTGAFVANCRSHTRLLGRHL